MAVVERTVRVAVISRYPIIKVGLASLVGLAAGRAEVVDITSADGHLGGVDIVVYDLAGLDARADDLRHLLSSDAVVVGLARDSRPDLNAGARALGIRYFIEESTSSAVVLDTLEQASGAQRVRRRPTSRALGARELEIVRLIGAGRSNTDIAGGVFLSVNSVKTYIRTAYRKMGVQRRPEAVLWAVRHGVVDPRGEMNGLRS